MSPALGDKHFSKILPGRKRTQNGHENELWGNKESYISCISELVNLIQPHSRLNRVDWGPVWFRAIYLEIMKGTDKKLK